MQLWCDAQNEAEGLELTSLFHTTVLKWSTVSQFLWTIRNRPDLAYQTKHITTPAGWIAFRLTGKLTLVIGDASGMFPIDQTALDYNEHMLQLFDELNINSKVGPLKLLLPKVIRAGDNAGVLSQVGAGGGCFIRGCEN